MVRKLITFLGTGKYDPCNYELNGIKAEPTEYVQEAIIDLYIKRNTNIDEIHVLLTKEARENNWDGDNKLYGKLLKYPKVNIHAHDISSRQDIDIIWQLFDTISNIMEKNDQIVFDITHSFRYQPMLALLSIHFARITKDVQVDGIYYGVYDSKVEVKNFPIIDLTSFVDLQDWITNVYAFIKTGRVEGLSEWIQNREKAISQEERRSTIDLKYVRELAKNWQELASALQTNRSMDLLKTAEKAKESIEAVKNVMLRPAFTPLNELLLNVESEIESIADEDPIYSGIAAIEWCYKHGLYQQSYTLAVELMITAICLKHNMQTNNKDDREWATNILNTTIKKNQKTNGSHGEVEDEDRGIVDDLRNYSDLLKILHTIKDNRNDINHAGWRNNPLSSKVLEEHFISMFETYKTQLLNYYGKR
ncbi:TIGR02221 family CRISPR-associated protein [Caldifermentibacillus hisashii]|uniref:TIGR02221 family CRISPR-associated protein n=1 Tax=Caldifermentibacillus hisashii TaxID=996558 RepID=UPI003D214261